MGNSYLPGIFTLIIDGATYRSSNLFNSFAFFSW